jgi:hypothetical protein
MTYETYRITIKGHIDGDWSDWFDGLTITLVDNGETILSGPKGSSMLCGASNASAIEVYG